MNAVALTYKDAAAACGYSIDVIRKAVDSGDLVPSFANTKPVIRVVELDRWLESLPGTSPAERA